MHLKRLGTVLAFCALIAAVAVAEVEDDTLPEFVPTPELEALARSLGLYDKSELAEGRDVCGFGRADFQALTNMTYKGTSPDTTDYFLMRVCGVIPTSDKCSTDHGMLCRYNATGAYQATYSGWVSGIAKAWSYVNGKDSRDGVTLKTGNGQPCVNGTKFTERVVSYNFKCRGEDDIASTQSFTIDLSQEADCKYAITIPTPIVCGLESEDKQPNILFNIALSVGGLLLLAIVGYICSRRRREVPPPSDVPISNPQASDDQYRSLN